MTLSDLIQQYGVLPLFGFGILFLVLILQVLLNRKVDRIIEALGLGKNAPVSAAQTGTTSKPIDTTAGVAASPMAYAVNNARLAAAISAAIAQYRTQN